MGYQERDYYREEGTEDPLGLKSMSATAKLIAITVFVYLVDLFFGGTGHKINELLLLHADVWSQPWNYYQFLTHGFIHSPLDIKHILGNMIGLWVFGRVLEERVGSAFLVRFYLLAIVVAGMAWAAHNYLTGNIHGECLGASGGVMAVIVLFCAKYPKATFFDKVIMPIPAWAIGVLYVAMDLYGLQFGNRSDDGTKVAYDAHLAGAAFALVIWFFQVNLGRGSVLDAPGNLLRQLTGGMKRRPPLRVHSELPETDDEDELLEREGDRILAKISTQGDGSLTAKERRTLEQYSRLMRAKRK
jgi:membrane associated rhomboid family serine protease